MFQSLTRDSNHSNGQLADGYKFPYRFNPSRGIAIIQTLEPKPADQERHGFNPSRGIAIIQTALKWRAGRVHARFNPSRGIAIIQTHDYGRAVEGLEAVSIPHAG